MSDSNLEPLSAELAELLRPGPAEPLSSAARAKLFERIDLSVATASSFEAPASAPSPATAGPASGAAGLGSAKLGALVVASLLTGAVVSRVVEHRYFPPTPVVIERVVVKTESAPAPPTLPPQEPNAVKPTSPAIVKPKVVERSASAAPSEPRQVGPVSSRERQLLEGARTALIKRDPDGALAALASHRQEFVTGQLAEERDALEVQALVAAGRKDDARAAAVRFKTAYPESIFGPSVDAFVQ
jgi:hypothetical protein